MANYKLGLCFFCAEPMLLTEIAEGVCWEATERSQLYSFAWWLEPSEECRVAHRRCWKALKEWERRSIRRDAEKAPRSLGQMV